MMLWGTLTSDTHGALVINPQVSITHRVTVQPVIVSNDDGSNTATFMGDGQASAIESVIDQIWGQAGIDIDFLSPNHWNDTFANVGTTPYPTVNGTPTRPTGDLSQIRSDGIDDGVTSTNPMALNMFIVRVSPGHPESSPLSAAGLAQYIVSGSDFPYPASTIFIGEDLPGAMSGGQPLGNQVAAMLISHEIGHNLGLDHLDVDGNLMQTAAPITEERLVDVQINLQQAGDARMSVFAVAVPEPSAFLGGLAVVLFGRFRRKVNGQFGAGSQ
ncbi:zinc metalloprotease [Crateriforma conspicua]|uniref:hypothetical protein n=1 Tax=Crateriforma conspicua TaxID=2527996 RepID=UPI0013FCFB12|nr:hypothetical protein [Crateriforma conspicua]